MSKNWYSFRSKDGKVKGYCPAESEAELARFAGYELKELVIKRVRWNGKEFTE